LVGSGGRMKMFLVSVSETIQSENMKDTDAFFIRNHRGTHTLSFLTAKERERACVWTA